PRPRAHDRWSRSNWTPSSAGSPCAFPPGRARRSTTSRSMSAARTTTARTRPPKAGRMSSSPARWSAAGWPAAPPAVPCDSAALLERFVGHPVAVLVHADLLAQQPCVEAGVRPGVPAGAAGARMARQECPHVLLGDGLEFAAELGIRPPDRCERVADEVGELHVDYAP